MEEFIDKCRKRGTRIAQKSTRKHHSRDNRRSWLSCHSSRLPCWDCEGWRNDTCTRCARLLYYRSNEPELDYELSDYLKNGDWTNEGEREFISNDLVE